MVIPVIEHHRPQKRDARQGEHFAVAAHEPPRRHQGSVVHASERLFRPGDTLIERWHKLGRALWTRIREIRRLRRRSRRQLRHSGGHRRDVQRQLPKRSRFRVRAP
jgi:hypothetical protein